MLKILAAMTGVTMTASLPDSHVVGLLGSFFEAWAAGEWRWFIFTGFLGGFTTFSAVALETARLFKVGEGRGARFCLGISDIKGPRQVFPDYRVARRCPPAA